MVNRAEYPDITAEMHAVTEKNRRLVDRDFWRKLLRAVRQIPFAEDLAAAYFCAVDPETPGRVRGILIGALAYFVTPIDVIPDFVAGVGFTDDAAVLAMAIGLVSRNIKPEHYERARMALGYVEPASDETKI
ncbi:MAG TPA: YkvA family protein [Rhizomicrobium sp.]|jgi:uncharacterized membrane protein YkvA (DUF1232 family)|nr:YkvA family protein [Rhizomicrobium sp.]